MAASDLANGVGMIKPKARHPLLPWQIRGQSLNLPIIVSLFAYKALFRQNENHTRLPAPSR